jgi:flap endonuclease-1
LKELPERFKALRGKRLVMFGHVCRCEYLVLTLLPGSDGTLMTQRFYFIPGKHPYQHIISWYRLAQELNENGVSYQLEMYNRQDVVFQMQNPINFPKQETSVL